LIHSEAARKGALEEHRSIKLSTYGIFFMGSPHQGAAGVHLGELVLRIASIFVATDDKMVKHIKLGSEWLEQQLQQYAPIGQDFVTKFAYETLPTTSIAMGKKIMVRVLCEWYSADVEINRVDCTTSFRSSAWHH
jgi:hypothetical protein